MKAMGIFRRMTGTIVVSLTLVAAPVSANGYLFFHDHQFDETGGTVYLGQVTDQRGRPLPDTQIQINVLEFNQALTLTTNAAGRFKSAGVSTKVHPSKVRVSAIRPGYRVLKKVNLSRSSKPGAPQEINFVMAPKAR